MIIRKPLITDLQLAKEMFEASIPEAYDVDGYGEYLEDIANEINAKMTRLNAYLASPETQGFYLVAEEDGRLIGTIAFGPIRDEIKQVLNPDCPSQGELGSMYILPEYQGAGIAREMIEKMMQLLKEGGIQYACFDSGFKAAQKKWRHKFGEPYQVVPNYYDEGVDLMIWLVEV